MSTYISKLKQNIRNLMHEKRISQQKLVDLTEINGTPILNQGRISDVLNSQSDSKCFTIDQLVAIADVFNMSLDELVGRTEKKKNTENRIDSLGDIAKMLFSLSEANVGLCFDTAEYADNYYTSIFFTNPNVDNYLREWKYYANAPSSHMKSETMKTFKESLIKTYSTHLRRYDYNNISSFAYKWLNSQIETYEAVNDIYLFVDDLKTLHDVRNHVINDIFLDSAVQERYLKYIALFEDKYNKVFENT